MRGLSSMFAVGYFHATINFVYVYDQWYVCSNNVPYVIEISIGYVVIVSTKILKLILPFYPCFILIREMGSNLLIKLQ